MQAVLISVTLPNEFFELTLEGIKQFFVAVKREEWKFDTLCDVYDALMIAQAVVFCNTKRKWIGSRESCVRIISLPRLCMAICHKGRDMLLWENSDLARPGFLLPQMFGLEELMSNRFVSLVINYDLPNNRELYIHRIGRTGRFGRKPCRGILLFGPPGTEKSLLAKAIATEIKANFINVLAASITFKWLEKTSNALFSYAKKLAHVVIYLDEVDSLLGARGENETSILKGFVAAWDGLELKESQRVLVIGGTKRPFDIDEAVICRMPRR
ncbi:hypothetical protein OROHE_004769 [Orobanche hederae]